MTATGQRAKVSALVKSAVSLMFSTVGSAALGFAFWLVSAHLFTPRAVGRASAAIAAVTLLSSIGQISVVWVLARFLPVARRRAGMIVRRGYATALTVTWVLACGFVVFGFGGNFLGPAALSRLAFVLIVMMAAIFALQDVVLTALRRAPWVLAENLAVGAARLAMLLVALAFARHTDVVIAWAAPMVVAVGVVNWFIFRKLVPARELLGDDHGLLPARSELMSYGTAQVISGAVANIANTLPPLLVVSRLGASAGAVFYFPWLFITAVMALVWNIVFSLVVEAVHDTSRSSHLFKRAAGMGALVTCGSALVLGFGAHLILGIVGANYRDSGAVTLQLFALSLPFIAVSSLYYALSLIERQTWTITNIEIFGAVLFIGGGVLLMPRFGASALGLTFLISHAVVALVTVPGIARRYQRLASPDPTVVLRVDREAEAMAAETQILYPLFVAMNPARHFADATTVTYSTDVFVGDSTSDQTTRVIVTSGRDEATSLTNSASLASEKTISLDHHALNGTDPSNELEEPIVPTQLHLLDGVTVPDSAGSLEPLPIAAPTDVES